MKYIFTFSFCILLFCEANSQEIWHQIGLNYPGNNTVDQSQYCAISPIGANLVYVMLDQGRFYKSVDGGASWIENQTGISENFFDLSFFDENLGFAVGSNGAILKTTDSGTTWNVISTETTEDLFSMEMISLNDIWVVGNHGTVLHSTDGGNSWNLNTSLSTEKLNSVQFNGNLGYIAGNNGTLLQTFDYGETWNSISLDTDEDLFSLNITETNTRFLAGNVHDGDYYFYEAENIYKTTNNTKWESHYFYSDDYNYVVSSMLFLNDNEGFLLSSTAMMCDCGGLIIYKTIDGGQTWDVSYHGISTGSVIFGGFSDLAFVNNSVGYALNGFCAFQTTNGGTGWNGYPEDLFGKENFESSSENYGLSQSFPRKYRSYPNGK